MLMSMVRSSVSVPAPELVDGGIHYCLLKLWSKQFAVLVTDRQVTAECDSDAILTGDA
jgi:hypothetical protein